LERKEREKIYITLYHLDFTDRKLVGVSFFLSNFIFYPTYVWFGRTIAEDLVYVFVGKGGRRGGRRVASVFFLIFILAELNRIAYQTISFPGCLE
jgi:hypothetical protein